MPKRVAQKDLIRAYLGKGIDYAISRNTLSILVKTSEKHIRDLIREMRYVDHEIICSTNNDMVYFYPDGASDMISHLDEIMSKQKQVMDYIQHLQKQIETDTGGAINYKNLPDIDIDYERERRSTEEIL